MLIGVFFENLKTRSGLCGGSLIDEQRFLTAAHCFFHNGKKATFAKIVLGEHDRQRPDYSKELESAVPMSRVFIHPGYVPQGRDHDIALVFLHLRVSWSDHPHIRPICLPSPLHNIDDYQGRQAVATGWGRTGLHKPEAEVLQEVSLTILSHRDCTQAFATTYNISEGMLCAGPTSSRGDTCRGQGLYSLDG